MKRVFLYWDGLLISKFDYNNKDELFSVGKKLLEQGLRQNQSFSKQRYIYRAHLNSVSNRKRDKQPIWNGDHQLGLGAMMALVIMKDIEELDDPVCGLFYPPKRKKRVKKSHENLIFS